MAHDVASLCSYFDSRTEAYLFLSQQCGTCLYALHCLIRKGICDELKYFKNTPIGQHTRLVYWHPSLEKIIPLERTPENDQGNIRCTERNNSQLLLFLDENSS